MLEGLQHFDIITDHKPLLPFLNKYSLNQIENQRLQRLREKLSPYCFTASWIPTGKNIAADALSRAPVAKPLVEDECAEDVRTMALLTEDACITPEVEDLRRATSVDDALQSLGYYVSTGFPDHRFQVPICVRPYWNVRSRLSMDNGLLLCGKLCDTKGVSTADSSALTCYEPRRNQDARASSHDPLLAPHGCRY